MPESQVSHEDVERAHALVDQMLRWACSPQEVRRRVERVLTECDVDSHRYAFWRLILALVVAESADPDSATTPRGQPALAC